MLYTKEVFSCYHHSRAPFPQPKKTMCLRFPILYHQDLTPRGSTPPIWTCRPYNTVLHTTHSHSVWQVLHTLQEILDLSYSNVKNSCPHWAHLTISLTTSCLHTNPWLNNCQPQPEQWWDGLIREIKLWCSLLWNHRLGCTLWATQER